MSTEPRKPFRTRSDGFKYINWRYVRAMFKNGKDTAFISDFYGVSEARIYNGLAKGKGIYQRSESIRSPSPHFNVVRHKRPA